MSMMINTGIPPDTTEYIRKKPGCSFIVCSNDMTWFHSLTTGDSLTDISQNPDIYKIIHQDNQLFELILHVEQGVT